MSETGKAKANLSKRGRPKGVLNGMGSKEKKWQPKTWKPIYEAMVSMHVQGYTNKFIANKLDVSEQTISNVVNCTAAQGIIKALQVKIRAATVKSAEEKAVESVGYIHDRIHGVLKDEDLASKSPFAMGSFALKAGQALGVLKDPSRNGDTGMAGVINNNTQVNILGNPDVINNLVASLAKSQQAMQLHSGITGESIGVIKNDYEPVLLEYHNPEE